MVGIGAIYEDYASCRLENDSDVAQSHAPAEMAYLPLSEPLVNVRATLVQALQRAVITPEEHDKLQLAAEKIFFKDRTYRYLVQAAIADADRALEILASLRADPANPKLDDARRLVEAVVSTPDQRSIPRFDWTFEATGFWNSLFPPPSIQ
jgi:hypothetical protein